MTIFVYMESSTKAFPNRLVKMRRYTGPVFDSFSEKYSTLHIDYIFQIIDEFDPFQVQ